MSLAGQTIHVVAPHFNMRGGVIKLLDYADHLVAFGAEVAVYSDDMAEPGLPLFSVPRLGSITERISFRSLAERPTLALDDIVLFTWPRDFIELAAWAPAGFDTRRFVHLVQSTQHANASFTRGYGRRLLRQPISRISVSAEVAEATAPYRPPSSGNPDGVPHAVVDEGHDWQYFAEDADGRTHWNGRPLRVGYTTWKSPLGDVNAARLAGAPEFEFRRIGEVASWAELRELYRWSDLFLGYPAPEEGFYMVGYEAMAAGAIVALPDVGGNRSYCRFGTNCIQTSYNDPASYAAAISETLEMTEDAAAAIRAAALAQVRRFDLATERAAVGEFFSKIAALPAR